MLAHRLSAPYTLTWPSRSRYPTGKWYKRRHHSRTRGTLFVCLYDSTLIASMKHRHVVPPLPNHPIIYPTQSNQACVAEQVGLSMLDYNISNSNRRTDDIPSISNLPSLNGTCAYMPTCSTSSTQRSPTWTCTRPLCVTMARVSIQLRYQRLAVRTQLTLFRPCRFKHDCS